MNRQVAEKDKPGAEGREKGRERDEPQKDRRDH